MTGLRIFFVFRVCRMAFSTVATIRLLASAPPHGRGTLNTPPPGGGVGSGRDDDQRERKDDGEQQTDAAHGSPRTRRHGRVRRNPVGAG
ncbi:hypothetical protein [Nocardioides sp. TF02-7]|uniref:hypothetical protein n=1 Tax=Nocardioides sp. TF02-7 TaxID=2917724 RepID=UPI001F068E3D|nr:hypothetical protein [Nocardioides sp. TF02-7]UMG93208.1 hypothetical protein MF408_02575 [Nocardioides sp. TF02-7]